MKQFLLSVIELLFALFLFAVVAAFIYIAVVPKALRSQYIFPYESTFERVVRDIQSMFFNVQTNAGKYLYGGFRK